MDEPNCNECELADDLIKNLNIDVSISSVVRLGKQSDRTANRPEPIRITFDSPQVVLTVLKSKKITVECSSLEKCMDYYGFNIPSKEISIITKEGKGPKKWTEEMDLAMGLGSSNIFVEHPSLTQKN